MRDDQRPFYRLAVQQVRNLLAWCDGLFVCGFGYLRIWCGVSWVAKKYANGENT